MASTGKSNGTLVSLYIDGTEVAHATSHSLSLSMATRDTTTKDSGGWEEVAEGLRSGECSIEGFFAEDASYGFDDLFALYNNRSSFTAKLSTEVTGDKYYQATAYLTSLEKTSPVEDTETFSGSIKFTGTITEGTAA